ncbi:hypothetical protein AB0F91_31840 [Amycolatopsis sp. NPDC023774]|uniref:hypothetical protein n=1 Tax=Amycolatopsis sp. NPDC023774 TaxID=3155015 RepID=UPI0033CED69E
MLHWIDANKGWLFDGLFVGLPIAIVGGIWALIQRRNRKNSRDDGGKNVSQRQKSGKNSINFQSAEKLEIKDFKIDRVKEHDSVDPEAE